MDAGPMTALLRAPAMASGADPNRGTFGVRLGDTIADEVTLDHVDSGSRRGVFGFTPAEQVSGFDE